MRVCVYACMCACVYVLLEFVSTVRIYTNEYLFANVNIRLGLGRVCECGY